MTTIGAKIDDFSIGDDINVRRVIPVEEATTLSIAWLMVKRRYDHTDEEAIIAKTITSVEDITQGSIESIGDIDAEAVIVFYITSLETSILTPYTEYVYSIKVKYNTNKVYTVELGTLIAYPAVKIGNI